MIDSTTIKAIEADLRIDEGNKSKPYKDTRGVLTIGIGHNLEDGLCSAAIEVQFEHDLGVVLNGLNRTLPWWISQPPAVQRVLANMAFELGIAGLLNFHRFLAALQTSNYSSAILELQDSDLASQVPSRVSRLVSRLQTVVDSQSSSPNN